MLLLSVQSLDCYVCTVIFVDVATPIVCACMCNYYVKYISFVLQVFVFHL